MSNSNLVPEILIIAILSLLFLFLFSFYVPFNMDEFCHYQAMSYNRYPINIQNKFLGSYRKYDLAPISNYYLPLRSYRYQGSFSCVIYYPLFKLWPSPYSARLLGLTMLAMQAFCIYKLFKIDMLVSFILFLSCMPYAFQHIVDTGPIIFQTTSVFFICYLTQRWTISLEKDAKYSWGYPLTIGIILFLGIWIKLAYLFILPGILILILYYLIAKKSIFISYDKVKTLIRHLVISSAAGVIPTFILLNSADRKGHKYYEIIAKFAKSRTVDILNLKALQQHFCYNIAKYLINPMTTAHRIFDVRVRDIPFAGILLIVVIIAFLFLGIRQLYLKKVKFGFVFLNIALFLLSIFIMSMCPRTNAMHHVILSLPFLILASFYIYSELYKNRLVLTLLIVFLTANFSLYFNLTRLNYHERSQPSKLKLNELLNRRYANGYVFIVIDWGMYYLKTLYGNKNQYVLWIEPFTEIKQVAKVKKILARTKRKALFIGKTNSVSDLSLIKKAFPNIVELETDFDTGVWRVYYEP